MWRCLAARALEFTHASSSPGERPSRDFCGTVQQRGGGGGGGEGSGGGGGGGDAAAAADGLRAARGS